MNWRKAWTFAKKRFSWCQRNPLLKVDKMPGSLTDWQGDSRCHDYIIPPVEPYHSAITLTPKTPDKKPFLLEISLKSIRWSLITTKIIMNGWVHWRKWQPGPLELKCRLRQFSKKYCQETARERRNRLAEMERKIREENVLIPCLISEMVKILVTMVWPEISSRISGTY